MKWSAIRATALACATTVVTAAEVPPRCESERFFSPDDPNKLTPLSRPHPELRKDLELAKAGNALAQRNVAVSYHAGYLVDACEPAAAFWMSKAARGGDKYAQNWVARHDNMERFRQGPECMDASCPGIEQGPVAMYLSADRLGHFRTFVTIGTGTVWALVDTGASHVSMSANAARQMGINYQNGRKATMTTANGPKSVLIVTVDKVRAGNIVLSNVSVAISEADQPTLLGMSFLGRLNMSVTQGHMTLVRP